MTVQRMKILVVCLLASLSAACSTKLTQIPVGTPVAPPAAYIEFCRSYPCVDQSTYSVIPRNDRVLATIQKAHTYLRDNFVSEREPEGQANWQLGMRGDCEDYALTLRDELRALYPSSAEAFGLATAYTELDQYHAVMKINFIVMPDNFEKLPLDQRDPIDVTYVCDLRYPQCAPWNTFPYEYHLVQNGQRWERLAQ